MRLFISWSGRRSQRLAMVLKEWLETHFSGHGISVFVSSEITGSLWLPSVNAELRQADAGLICLTANSLDSQWMLFEAGALSTAVALGTGESRIFTYLLGVDRAALPSPLSVYQSAVATMEDTLRLINSLLGYLNAAQVGAGAFVPAWDDLWPRLQRIEEEEEMTDWSLKGVFLSYRREDAGPYARLLQYELRERILDARVFMDLDSIEAGLDFAEVIRQAVESCAVVVALIGRQWATLTDEEGRLRLDDPDDYVRYEIEAALARGVRVIPVLVDGARPLRQLQLPAELRKLARLNALELSYSRYQYDSDRLLDLLQRLLAAAPSAGPP